MVMVALDDHDVVMMMVTMTLDYHDLMMMMVMMVMMVVVILRDLYTLSSGPGRSRCIVSQQQWHCVRYWF